MNIKKIGLRLILVTVILGWVTVLLFNRSFEWMDKLARGQFPDTLHEYRIDTAGFQGPFLSLWKNKGLVYVWEKKITDSNSVQIEVHVGSRRFSETIVSLAGGDANWKKLLPSSHDH